MTIEELDKRPFPRWEVRLWEIVPAAISWSLLLLPIVLTSTAPVLVAYFMILFDLWWFFRSMNFSVALVRSFRRMRRNADKPWRSILEASDLAWEDLVHVVVFPFYNEDFEVLAHSVQAMAATDYPRDRVCLVIAAEARGGDSARDKAERLAKVAEGHFAAVHVAIHPDKIPGEVRGKGPNITYAMQSFEREVLPSLHVAPQRVIVHSIDCDSVFHPQHFAHTAYVYATTPLPTQRIYQFIPLYHNNLWDVPAMMRIIATGNTFWLLYETTRPHRTRNFAVYATSLETLHRAHYWDKTSIIEDGVQYWRHLFAYSGDHSVVAVDSPVYMDAVLGASYWGTFLAQYKQLRRWSWGASDLSFVVPGFFRSPEIPRWQRIVEVLRLLDNHISWSTAPLLLILVGWLPMLNRQFQDTALGYNLPTIASTLLTLALIGVICAITISVLLQPKPRERRSFGREVLVLVQWALLPFITIFLSIPAIHSQTLLAFGHRVEEFTVTVKKRALPS